jgi:hypothetical protein
MTSLVKVKLVGASEITAHMRSGHCRGILGNPETVSIGEKSRLRSEPLLLVASLTIRPV